MLFSEELRRVIEFIERRFGSLRAEGAEEDGFTRWRERILLSILAASTALCLLALAPALYLAVGRGLWVLAVSTCSPPRCAPRFFCCGASPSANGPA